MSTKELHVLKFWRKALIDVYKEKGAVSAGEVGKAVGQSRSTAKKYLERLIAERCAESYQVTWRNGIIATVYSPMKG